jgi:hypothetical protein
MNRLTVLLSIAVTCLALVACSEPEAEDPPSPSVRPSEPARAAPREEGAASSADEIALKTGLTIVMKPVLRGLQSSTKYTLSLTSWQLGPASVAFAGPDNMTGSAKVSEQGREEGRAFVAPFFWGSGQDSAAPGPIVWLSRAAFRELQSKGETSIAPTSLPGGAPPGGGSGLAPLSLKKTGTATHLMTMLDRQVRVPVIVAEDDSGTQYSILDTPANPLVVSVRYGPRSKVGGATLPDSFSAVSGYDVTAVEQTAQPKLAKPSEPMGRPAPIPTPSQGR